MATNADFVQKKRAIIDSYVAMAKAFRVTSDAITDFVATFGEVGHPSEALSLLTTAGMEQIAFPFVAPGATDDKLAAHEVKKRAKKAGADDGEEATEAPAKKAKKEKKVKDPNAPKRAPSAYLEYQNAVRQTFKEDHPDVPYKELMQKIGEKWTSLTDSDKKTYQDINAKKVAEYEVAKAAYEAAHAPDADVEMVDAPPSAPAPVVEAPPPKAKKSKLNGEEKAKAPKEKEKAPAKVAKPAKVPTPPVLESDSDASTSDEESSEESDDSDEAEQVSKTLAASKKAAAPSSSSKSKAAEVPSAEKGKKKKTTTK